MASHIDLNLTVINVKSMECDELMRRKKGDRPKPGISTRTREKAIETRDSMHKGNTRKGEAVA